jgi:hypothetical protein
MPTITGNGRQSPEPPPHVRHQDVHQVVHSVQGRRGLPSVTSSLPCLNALTLSGRDAKASGISRGFIDRHRHQAISQAGLRERQSALGVYGVGQTASGGRRRLQGSAPASDHTEAPISTGIKARPAKAYMIRRHGIEPSTAGGVGMHRPVSRLLHLSTISPAASEYRRTSL